jgi:hypothetical protein
MPIDSPTSTLAIFKLPENYPPSHYPGSIEKNPDALNGSEYPLGLSLVRNVEAKVFQGSTMSFLPLAADKFMRLSEIVSLIQRPHQPPPESLFISGQRSLH